MGCVSMCRAPRHCQEGREVDATRSLGGIVRCSLRLLAEPGGHGGGIVAIEVDVRAEECRRMLLQKRRDPCRSMARIDRLRHLASDEVRTRPGTGKNNVRRLLPAHRTAAQSGKKPVDFRETRRDL